MGAPDIDWDALSFGIDHVAPVRREGERGVVVGGVRLAAPRASTPTPSPFFSVSKFMYRARWSPEGGYVGGVVPYGPLSLDPSAQVRDRRDGEGGGRRRQRRRPPTRPTSTPPQVLNYGQSVFEGMKAQRSAKGRIVLFRPDKNAARCAAGAARLSMPPVPEAQFADAVAAAVRANAAWVPPRGKGSLYLRPLLLGTGPILGLGPAPYYDFIVFGAAVGAYFKGGQLSPIDLVVEEKFHRAAPRGMGGTKAAGNYSPVLVTQLAAKKEAR